MSVRWAQSRESQLRDVGVVGVGTVLGILVIAATESTVAAFTSMMGWILAISAIESTVVAFLAILKCSLWDGRCRGCSTGVVEQWDCWSAEYLEKWQAGCWRLRH